MIDKLQKKSVQIKVDSVVLEGEFVPSSDSRGVVIFAHGSGSSRLSPRNQFVAKVLQKKRFGTLLFDLLTVSEDSNYETRFDIDLLTTRLLAATEWLQKQSNTNSPLGYFGASTGAAAALQAASGLGRQIKAIVSRGGRPDLAEEFLERVQSPTLLIVGGLDVEVLKLNEMAFRLIGGQKKLEIIPEATHLFEEPGALEEASRLAALWFEKFLL